MQDGKLQLRPSSCLYSPNYPEPVKSLKLEQCGFGGFIGVSFKVHCLMRADYDSLMVWFDVFVVC